MKRALILGIGGMDGSYLAEVLLEKNYEVHGLVRRSSVDNLVRIRHLLEPKPLIRMHEGDLSDTASVLRIINDVEPHEIYNEADQDSIDWSYHTPSYNWDVTAGAVGRILETLKPMDLRSVRFFQPLSITMFGESFPCQNETTPFRPASPYACAKVGAYYLCQHYRREYGVDVRTAIFGNHDSPRRGSGYLLQRICRGAVRIAAAEQEAISLSNLNARVDIGYAREYMEAAYRIMQLPKPDDFVIGSGEAPTIQEWVEAAFIEAGVQIESRRIQLNPAFNRPGATPTFFADHAKARERFGWSPQWGKKRLVASLVEAAWERLKCEHANQVVKNRV